MFPPPPAPRGFVRRARAAAVRALVLALTATAALLFAQPTPAQAATSRQIAVPTAPMGWASWNSFAAAIDYDVIKQQVD
ncbi:MAG: alpha-galactosidase, partial [Streptomyces sp.]|nr:alpha-galactosidase [Streptomyces sp.]